MSKKPAPPPKKEEKPAAAAPKETKPAEGAAAKPQKAEKGKHEKKHREEKGVHAMYKAEGSKVTRARPICERCGAGFFMADHHNRFTCGHCGFTRYKQK
jgi:ubiquitin-small subunit ribosomal protein S27Ae